MNGIGIYDPLSYWLRETNGDSSANAFRVDIEEDDKQYRIYADLPGAEKNQVSVSVEDNVLSLRAKTEAANSDALRRERPRGEFARTFRLPRKTDEKGIKASMKNGVLTVTVPKAKTSGRAVEIH